MRLTIGHRLQRADALYEALVRAVGLFRDPARYREVQLRAMRQDFGWHRAAQAYEQLYSG